MIVTPDGGSTPGPSFRRDAPLPEAREWYALRTRCMREFRVRDQLTELGSEYFLPTYEATVRWSDREKTVHRPYFPGYIFVRMQKFAIKGAPVYLDYVKEVLSIGREPVAIPEKEIEALKRAIESRLSVERCPYVVGSPVTVKTGPLAGVSGIVERVSGETRITISCELLRRAVRVGIDAADLEAAA